MTVRALMTARPNLVSIGPDDTTRRAVRLLMRHEVGALPVVDEARRPLGLVAERDVVRGLDEHGEGVLAMAVRRIMRQPPPVCHADDRVQDIMARMTRERVRHYLVRDGEELVGVLSVGDLLKNRLHQLETEAGVLRDYVAGQRGRF